MSSLVAYSIVEADLLVHGVRVSSAVEAKEVKEP